MPKQIRQNGEALGYTCENAGYRTDIVKGFAHGNAATTAGSVFPEPLTSREGDYSLWLEHAVEKKSGDECYWLMWYDGAGAPTISMSAILNRDDIANMQRLF